MAFHVKELTVTDSAVVDLVQWAETDASSPSVPTFARKYGTALTVVTSGDLLFGETNDFTSGVSFPAGVFNYELDSSEHVYVRAPSGTTVTVKIQGTGF